jgi:hypothetical protein
MKKQILWLALGVAAFGCGNDHTTASASANPDPESCSKGSISTGDAKLGTLTDASCVRFDHAYSQDSQHFDSYSFKAEKGKGYMFALDASDNVTNWDALLELADVNPATGEQELLAISDDEGGNGYSRMYFIAPASGTFYIRASGFDFSDLSSYRLTAKSCDSPIAEITGSLPTTTFTLSATDCVLAQPQFVNDSSNIKLFTINLGPNETKTVTVTSSDFVPGFQIYGPAWGVPCYYQYMGCGGGVEEVTKSDTRTIVLTADGNEECNNALHAPDHVGPLASVRSASISICEFFNWPGQYTLTVGSFGQGTGSFTLAVTEGDATLRVVAPHPKNPTLEFLKRKPFRSNSYM